MSLIPQIFEGNGNEEVILDPFLSLINKCPVLNTPTDWKETPKAHVFVADLPGLTKDQVKVEVVDGRVLQISGERKNDDDVCKNDTKNSHDTWRRVERCRGKFHRRFRLPENAKVDEVKASMENGVLTVIIPKQEVKKPERKLIQIQAN
ncbi:18.1 kDa class I heat shock protein-like [Humulus lupulus]|uniref:18.1 kDa class I heat shock protein-like n=1 Tax=Humulus lupulus TaxID=3486 RepID=UPI002B406F3F|nr:18.1 kDa class I heat shock protein-like [Humulus lupulus]